MTLREAIMGLIDDIPVTTDAGELPLVLCARFGDIQELLCILTGMSKRDIRNNVDDEFPSLYDNIPHLFVVDDETNDTPLRAALKEHLLEHGVERILIVPD